MSIGSTFGVALSDVVDGVNRHEAWIHQGMVDVIRRYQRTKIGPLWHTLSLAAFIVVMGTIWSVVLGVPATTYFKHVTTGLIAWSLISGAIVGSTALFISNQSTALSIRYPFTAFAFAHVWRQILIFAHHLILWVILVVTIGPPISFAMLLLFPGMVVVILNLFWISLLIGMISLRFRDAAPAVSAMMQIALFATPVLWSPDFLGDELKYLSTINPLYHLVTLIRAPLLSQPPSLVAWAFAILTAVLGIAFTLYVYGRVKKRIAYWY